MTLPVSPVSAGVQRQVPHLILPTSRLSDVMRCESHPSLRIKEKKKELLHSKAEANYSGQTRMLSIHLSQYSASLRSEWRERRRRRKSHALHTHTWTHNLTHVLCTNDIYTTAQRHTVSHTQNCSTYNTHNFQNATPGILLSEISQTEKDKHCILLICGI